MSSEAISNEIKHVCCLMDGTRTYEFLNGTSPAEINEKAYYNGMLGLENLMKMTFNDFNIPFLSVNLIGRKNCFAREDSSNAVADVQPFFFTKKWKDYLIENSVRVRFIGDIDLFCSTATNPKEVKDAIAQTEKLTAGFEKYNLILMAAYEPTHEYLKLLNNGTAARDRETLIKHYYGFDVPDVNVMIRAWRFKLSGCVPLFVSEYADMYFYPAPFLFFNKEAYQKILLDYSQRIMSKSEIPDAKEIAEISKYKDMISKEPMPIGRLVGNRWLPIS